LPPDYLQEKNSLMIINAVIYKPTKIEILIRKQAAADCSIYKQECCCGIPRFRISYRGKISMCAR
jgi:hypothetical protein